MDNDQKENVRFCFERYRDAVRVAMFREDSPRDWEYVTERLWIRQEQPPDTAAIAAPIPGVRQDGLRHLPRHR